MSYLVLARKYRPKTFSEVAGQDVVTRTLRGAIAEGRVGHAYMFFGPRGTGKTTSARLFAKALNCENGPAAEPCGVCERCLSHDAGTEPDLIEIDAASNTGVEHVRSLRDQAGYVPLKARFKIFLVDEVHMLSKPAFNALLKTLEEPPPHVKFLFATTELHKVPDTVASRCQVLRLSPLTEEQIRSRLDEVFELEGIEAEHGVTAEIARRARGGMRDALSLADQLLALVGRAPRVADTARLAGEGSADAIEAMLDAILASDRPRLLAALPGRQGDEAAFLDATLDYLRGAMLLRLVGEDAPMLAEQASPEVKARMIERASAFGAERLELVLQELLHARERMGPIHMRAHARLILETTLLDLCAPEATMPLPELIKRLEALEQRAGGAPQVQSGSRPRERRPEPRPAAPDPAPASAPAASPKPQAERPRTEAPAPEPERSITPPAPPASGAARKAPRSTPGGGPGAAGGAPEAQPVHTNSTQDLWNAFLDELARRSAPLAEITAKRARLVRGAAGVVPLGYRGLTEREQGLLESPDGHRALTEAFAAVHAGGLRLKVEIHGAGRGAGDAFTEEVRALFDGKVEG
ncbi:MAG: DNA polymerase III subunit gamma/tau [Planctomycetota bacterium]|nr:DNA polymerase III subunit gamma/tau [Planctomycetota bacterium]